MYPCLRQPQQESQRNASQGLSSIGNENNNLIFCEPPFVLYYIQQVNTYLSTNLHMRQQKNNSSTILKVLTYPKCSSNPPAHNSQTNFSLIDSANECISTCHKKGSMIPSKYQIIIEIIFKFIHGISKMLDNFAKEIISLNAFFTDSNPTLSFFIVTRQ